MTLSSFFGLWSAVAVFGMGGLLAKPAPNAIVIGDVTAAGMQRTAPTRESPSYYFPVIAGHRELGAVMGGTKPPAPSDLLRALAKALAQENYLMVTPGTTPDLMLVIWWGNINPQIDEFEWDPEVEVAPTRVFVNQREMLSLVGAFKADVFFKSDRDNLKEAARDDRYFILVAAFDFAAAQKQEKKLLWSARMSTESTGREPDEIFPHLAASGAAVFGRDTPPAMVDTSKPLRNPDIEVGPLEVIEVLAEETKR